VCEGRDSSFPSSFPARHKVHGDGRIFIACGVAGDARLEKLNRIKHLEFPWKGTVIAAGRNASADNFSAGGVMTTDPVCGIKVDERRSEFETQFEGKKYYFCSEGCKQEFEADPQDFVGEAAA
jgi:YHS domain-containing protein